MRFSCAISNLSKFLCSHLFRVENTSRVLSKKWNWFAPTRFPYSGYGSGVWLKDFFVISISNALRVETQDGLKAQSLECCFYLSSFAKALALLASRRNSTVVIGMENIKKKFYVKRRLRCKRKLITIISYTIRFFILIYIQNKGNVTRIHLCCRLCF